MNITPKEINTIIKSIQSQLWNEFSVYTVEVWNVGDKVEKYKELVRESDWDDFVELYRFIPTLLSEIVRYVKKGKVNPRNFLLKNGSFNLWIAWILFANNLITLDMFMQRVDWSNSNQNYLKSDDFRAWEPFFKFGKIENEFLTCLLDRKYANCILQEYDEMDGYNITMFLDLSGSCTQEIKHYDVSGEYTDSPLEEMLKAMVGWEYSHAEAIPFFHPKTGYFANYFANHAALNSEDLRMVYKQRVVKAAFDKYFPVPTKEKKIKKTKSNLNSSVEIY